MVQAVDFASLLGRPEGETIDFKAVNYALSDPRKKRDFAKDLASLANTPREGDAYIVLGVKKLLDGSVELWGIENDIDDAQLQSVASSLLDDTPRFLFEVVPHDGKDFGLITIQIGQTTPTVPKTTEDPGFVRGEIYFRRGSQNGALHQSQNRAGSGAGFAATSLYPQIPTRMLKSRHGLVIWMRWANLALGNDTFSLQTTVSERNIVVCQESELGLGGLFLTLTREATAMVCCRLRELKSSGVEHSI